MSARQHDFIIRISELLLLDTKILDICHPHNTPSMLPLIDRSFTGRELDLATVRARALTEFIRGRSFDAWVECVWLEMVAASLHTGISKVLVDPNHHRRVERMGPHMHPTGIDETHCED